MKICIPFCTCYVIAFLTTFLCETLKPCYAEAFRIMLNDTAKLMLCSCISCMLQNHFQTDAMLLHFISYDLLWTFIAYAMVHHFLWSSVQLQNTCYSTAFKIAFSKNLWTKNQTRGKVIFIHYYETSLMILHYTNCNSWNPG